jgi:hypothetical protein
VNEFLKKGFEDGRLGLSEIKNIFENIITYIPRATFAPDQTNEILVHFKVVYDVLKLIQRCNPEAIPPHFKITHKFQQFRAFEECIQFISSLHHLSYEISFLLFLNIKEGSGPLKNLFNKLVTFLENGEERKFPEEIKEKLNGSRYLTDSDELGDNIPRVADHAAREYHNSMLTEAQLEQTKIFKKNLEAQLSYLPFLEKGKDSKILLQRTVDQNKRYLIEVNKLKNRKMEKLDDFLEMLENVRLIGIQGFYENARKLEETILSYRYSFSFMDQ